MPIEFIPTGPKPETQVFNPKTLPPKTKKTSNGRHLRDTQRRIVDLGWFKERLRGVECLRDIHGPIADAFKDNGSKGPHGQQMVYGFVGRMVQRWEYVGLEFRACRVRNMLV